MSIHRTKQPTDLEKRFNQLSQQIYGQKTIKKTPSPAKTDEKHSKFSFNSANIQTKSNESDLGSEVTYLKISLLKITLLSALAIGAQFLIYYLEKINAINLNLLV